MMIFPESLHASEEVSGPIFCKTFLYIYIYIYIYIYTDFYTVFIRFKWINAFYMSSMCL